jgi:hypothetical protein
VKYFFLGLTALLFASPLFGQQVSDMILHTPAPRGEGWYGFYDIDFLIDAALNLALAAVLGAIIAYHPRHSQTADTLEEIEASQIYVLYSVIGSITGILVVQYGMAVGFVLFGIGALIRFRTVLRSASLTGRLIFVTLIGLSCGLELPHVAVLVTVFGFGLIYLLDSRFTFRIEIRGLSADGISESAKAYRTVLDREDCRVISERKRPSRGRVTFIIRSSRTDTCKEMLDRFEETIDPSLKGTVDWEIA